MWRQGLLYVFLVLLGLGIGYGLFVAFGGRPNVGVISIPYAELYDSTAADIEKMLVYAQNERSIKAVVVSLTSPGGGGSESESLFRSVLRLKQEKPVVISIGWIAASGGYMMSAPANYVYAKGSSFVGNVGAIMWIPKRQPVPEEEIVATGPFKLTGGSGRSYLNMLEVFKDAFVRMVVSQRGPRLRMSPRELAEGRLFSGIEAVRYGLVDDLGTEIDAIKKAAQLAGLRSYGIVNVNEAARSQGLGSFYFSSSRPDPRQSRYHRIDYLYLEPR